MNPEKWFPLLAVRDFLLSLGDCQPWPWQPDKALRQKTGIQRSFESLDSRDVLVKLTNRIAGQLYRNR